MDRALPIEVVRKSRIKKLSGVTAVVLFVSVGFFALRAVISPTLQRDKIRAAIAERGSIEATVTASGVVVPEFEQVIISPVSSIIEKTFKKSGDSVKSGEPVLQLNKDVLQMSYKQLQDEWALKKNKKQQLKFDLERKQIDLQASHEIKKLQTQFVQSRYDRVKYLHDIGGANQEEFDRASLNLEIARRELEQVARQLENQKVSVTAELQGLDLEILIQENKIHEIRRDLELADARAGRAGVLTWVNDNLGSQVSPGDELARVTDLGSFKVEAGISDIHADKLKVGGAVRVRIGEKILAGQINSIRPAVQNGIMTFIVELEKRADRSLRPSLRTDVFVVTSYTDDVVRVKNGPFYTGLVDQEVFIIKGDRAVRKIVNIGAANFDYVEIQGDIAPGDEVIISDMRDYRHMKEIDIEEK